VARRGSKLGENETLPEDLILSPAQLASFRMAPITTCDVERSFSMLKRTLSYNRQSLTPEHIEMMLVVQSYVRAG
jgi:hypothetical protein